MNDFFFPVALSVFAIFMGGVFGTLSKEKNLSTYGALVAVWMLLLAILSALERILAAIT